MELTKRMKKMTSLGYGGCFITYNGIPFYLHHEINQKFLFPRGIQKQAVLSLEGHSHFYQYSEKRKTIKVPTCSDNHPNKIQDAEHAPGFGILQLEKNRLTFTNYQFCEDEIGTYAKLILKK